MNIQHTSARSVMNGLFEIIFELGQNVLLSMISVKFYCKIYKQYGGYGLKYIFTLSFISSLVFCVIILNYITSVKQYLDGSSSTAYISNIDFVLDQLPEIKYNGSEMIASDTNPIYLYDRYKRKVAILDLADQLSFKEKAKVPIIFTSKNIILSIIENIDHKASNIPIAYSKIFGDQPKILNAYVIKKDLSDIFSYLPRILIYFVTPILVLIKFVTFLSEKSFLMILLFGITRIWIPSTTYKQCIRMALFTSGPVILLQPIVFLFFPEFISALWMIQMWCNFLMFAALFQIRNQY